MSKERLKIGDIVMWRDKWGKIVVIDRDKMTLGLITIPDKEVIAVPSFECKKESNT